MAMAVKVHAAIQSAAAACSYPTTTTGHSIWGPIARPLAAVLAWFYSLVPNYAFAIIGVGVAWAIIIAPLTLKSTRSMLAMQRLQPQMKKLQAEHKNDRQALNQAMMDLYKQEGVSPLGGCLPMLLPFPVFIALFDLIDGLSSTQMVNGVRCPDPRFLSPHTAMFHAIWNANGHLNAFGFDLAKNALSSHPSFLAALPYFVLLLVMIGTQYLQSAQMYARNPSAQDNPQARMMKYLPIVFGIIFIRFPAGVILYYAASSILRILQQSLMYRFDPAVRRLADRDIKEVEQEVDDIEAGRLKRILPGSGGRGGGDERPTKASGPGARFREALARQQEAMQERGRGQDRAGGGKTPGGAKTPGGGKTPAGGRSPAGGKAPAAGKAPPGGKARPGEAKAARQGRPAGGQPARGRADAGPAKPTGGRGARQADRPAAKSGGRPAGAAAGKPTPSTKKTDNTGKAEKGPAPEPSRPPAQPEPAKGTNGNGNGSSTGAPTQPASNGDGTPASPRPRRSGSRTGATSNRPGSPGNDDRKRRGR